MPETRVNLLLAILALAAPTNLSAGSEDDRHFTLKVAPLLGEKCFGCHGVDPATGKENFKGGLDLRSREAMLAGGETIDDVLVPGAPHDSFLIRSVKWEDPDYEMPPKENDRLTPAQIAWLEEWIAAGAPWPDEARQQEIRLAERARRVTEDGEIVPTSGGLGDDWTYRRYQPEDLWALRPVKKPQPPELGGSFWQDSTHPIDAFIGARLAAAGLEPAPEAAPHTLLRRLHFDLTGLPPGPEEMNDFLAAWDRDAETAWTTEIDRLLASPRYGERWAQHWLDVVRYADTAGYSNDWEMANLWRFRDYVIRSLNDDKPWNRFILEQLAGDELDPADPEMKVATGFLRAGPWEHTAMSPEVESRQLYLDDVVNSTGVSFLSTTMKCVKCHDHKFDPIPTRDYYRMYSVFATTQPSEMEAPYLESENLSGFDASRAHVAELLRFAREDLERLETKREQAARAWYAERGLPYKDEQTRSPLDEPKPPRFAGLTTAEQGILKVREQDVRIWERALERFEPLAQSVHNGGDLFQLSIKLRPPTTERALKKSRQLPVSKILMGGSIYAEGEPVTPGVLSAVGLATDTATPEDPFALPADVGGRRLALARWIASDDNTLATRSIVNRIWHYHFGRGIAANPNNFGATGRKPTHPELLDWLTAEFVRSGWSVKSLHRLILTSQAWRMDSQHPQREAYAQKDPNNELWWVFEPRRLSAEELRDSMLAITGELNLEMGGLPVFPEINPEVALSPRKIQFSLAPAWQPSATPEERHRRSIYTYRVRTLPDPLLEVFNRPNPDDSCELRDAAVATPQVFTMMNSERMVNRSIAFALRLEREEDTPGERLSRAFELAFQRPPRPQELARLTSHFEEMAAYHRNHALEKRTYPERITRALVEELSGDPFEYEELLNGYRKFKPDPGPEDVTPETRALADIALLIFNSNEFAFVY